MKRYKAFYKVHYRVWWVRSRRVSERRFTEMQACGVVIKNREVHWQFQSDVSKEKKEVFEDMQNNGAI